MRTNTSIRRPERLSWVKLSASVAAIALQTVVVSHPVVVAADEPDLSLQGGTLVVAVKERRSLRFGRKDGPPLNYTLYELIRPAAANAFNAGLLRVEGAKGLGREAIVTVAAKPIARMLLQDKYLKLPLPRSGNYATACYVISDVGSVAIERPGGGNIDEKFAFSLRPAVKAFEIEDRASRAAAEVKNAESSLDALVARIERAERDWPTHAAYQAGACVAPPVGAVPPRPEGALPLTEAAEIASALVFETMSRRLGCEAVEEAANRLGLTSDWRRFTARFTCGRSDLSALYPYGSWTPVLDYLESRLSSCADKDLGCLVGAVVTYAARYKSDVDQITRRLSEPYERWRRQVAEITALPARLMNECTEMAGLVQSRNRLIANAEAALSAVRAEERAAAAAVEAFAKNGVRKEDWRCGIPFKSYVGGGGDLRFVS